MDQLYFDGMAICGHVGFLNLFITLTCYPNCPKIRRLLSPLNLKPDIVSWIFRLKYEQMLSDLPKHQLLRKVVVARKFRMIFVVEVRNQLIISRLLLML